jgi:CRP/FNR family cyclic AMP-dependent transcriptional regulator
MYRQILSDLTIFQGLNQAQLDRIALMVDSVNLRADWVVFEQGDDADFLYILSEGEVVIRYKPYDGPPLIVAHIQPGGVFGWSSAVGHEVYSSGAKTVTPCKAYRLRGRELHRLCEQDPETGVIILDRLASVIAERLQSTHLEIMKILSQPSANCQRRIEENGK